MKLKLFGVAIAAVMTCAPANAALIIDFRGSGAGTSDDLSRSGTRGLVEASAIGFVSFDPGLAIITGDGSVISYTGPGGTAWL